MPGSEKYPTNQGTNDPNPSLSDAGEPSIFERAAQQADTQAAEAYKRRIENVDRQAFRRPSDPPIVAGFLCPHENLIHKSIE